MRATELIFRQFHDFLWKTLEMEVQSVESNRPNSELATELLLKLKIKIQFLYGTFKSTNHATFYIKDQLDPH